MLLNLPSPIRKLENDLSCQIFVKREDLIHQDFGGNKWRKLKYNLQDYVDGGHGCIVTFGGPFSNHIAATASICNYRNVPCVGLIRGTYEDPHNPTLLKAKAQGMQLHFIPKQEYKLKLNSPYIREVLSAYDNPLVIPEGGSNALGYKGTSEIMTEVYEQGGEFDYVIVAAGTGATAAGIIASARNEKVLVVNALRNPSLGNTIQDWLPEERGNWTVTSDYTFGGFAKVTSELLDFISDMNEAYNLSLDPIYNGKAFYAMMDLVSKNYFSQKSRILYIHTGGHQGMVAYKYREGRKK